MQDLCKSIYIISANMLLHRTKTKQSRFGKTIYLTNIFEIQFCKFKKIAQKITIVKQLFSFTIIFKHKNQKQNVIR